MRAPELFAVRPADHGDDIWRLARERDLAALGRVETARAWIDGRLASPGLDPERDARLLVGADGAALGALWLSRPSGQSAWAAELVLGPRATADDAGLLLSFAQERCRALLATGLGDARAQVSCFVSAKETAARAALRAAGYGSPHAYVRMSAVLDADLPSAVPVAGAVVRPVGGKEDLRTFHAVKNSAFSVDEAGKAEDGFEEWREWLEADPGADPAQRVLLEADGVAVGFANVTDRMLSTRDAAYVQQIGVVPRARRQGLGRLLLLSVMRRARRRGRTAMVLTVDAGNAPALALYGRLGWRVESRFDDFHRTVAVAAGAPGAVTPPAR